MHHNQALTESDADKEFALICERWQEYSNQNDISLLCDAYEFAKEAH